MVILRASAFEMNIHLIYAVETAEIHHEPCVEGTCGLVATGDSGRTTLPFGAGIAIQHAVYIVLSFRTGNNRQTRDLRVGLRSLGKIEHLELKETLTPLGSTLDSLVLDVTRRYRGLEIETLPTGFLQIALGVEIGESLAVSGSQQLEPLCESAFPKDLDVIEGAALT